MTKIYGIKNCGTMKKAFAWLDEQGIDYVFHDHRKDGLSEADLDLWLEKLGFEAMLNRQGTTWRKLDQDVKDRIDMVTARQLMLDNPAIIKRPLLVKDQEMLLGFSVDTYQAFFA